MALRFSRCWKIRDCQNDRCQTSQRRRCILLFHQFRPQRRLAWQLARNVPDTKLHIVDALAKNYSLPTSHLQRQFDLLIAEPLRKINVEKRPVMIIDGVDECTDDELQSQFLKILERSGTTGKTQLRFIICSRPEPNIRGILHKAPAPNNRVHVVAQARILVPQGDTVPRLGERIRNWIEQYLLSVKHHLDSARRWRPQHVAVLLQEAHELYRPIRREQVDVHQPAECSDEISPHPIISRIQIGHSPESEESVRFYLEDEFQDIGRERGLSSWFEQDDIGHLVKISCGQFLYASTVVRLLKNYSRCPAKVLKTISGCSSPDLQIDKLYEAILNEATLTETEQVDRRNLKDILSLLVVFSENIHFANVSKNIPILEALLAPEKGWLDTSLGKMHSLLRISEDSVGVYHRSFLEFLQNKSRSKSYWYISYPVALGGFVALLMKAALRYTFKRCFWQLR